MNETEKQIIKLTDIWYELVSLDHHKDRDCHWILEKVYSYGHPPIYRLAHNGYVYHDVDKEFGDSESAHRGLIEELQTAIKQEEDYADRVIKNPKDFDEYQLTDAKKIKEILSNPLNGTT